uniref:Uncharacterized protein n=1 Tax=viral metagenome TaxID=1070528 RepID=A0A6M3IKP8_9ZZZZ
MPNRYLWSDPRDVFDWDTISLVHAALQNGGTSVREISSLGVLPRTVKESLSTLRRDGHRIMSTNRGGFGRPYTITYIRPPGNWPCPECRRMMRKSQEQYYCGPCHERRIEYDLPTWPLDLAG